MNDDRRDDRSGSPDPSEDSWSAWLPELDPTRDRTQPPDESVQRASAAPPPKQPPAPTRPVPAQHLPHLPPPPPFGQTPRPAPSPWRRPTGRGQPASGTRPKTYLSVAILATIFCFWPFGIIAIIMAASVGSRWARGDVDGANRASRAARAWAVAAVVTMFLLFTVLYVFAGMMWRMGGRQ